MNYLSTKKSKKVIISLLFAVLIICSALFCFSTKTANADNDIIANIYLPKTKLECLSLNYPIDVYSDEHITAIAEEKKLIIEHNGILLQPYLDFISINQVEKLDSSSLLVYDNGIIYVVTLPNSPSQTIQKTQLIAGGSSFALNSTLLATKSVFSIELYDRNGNSFTSSTVHETIENVKKGTPITANDRYIFFVNQDGLCKYDINSKTSVPLVAGLFPDEMIANEDFVYLLLDGQIYRVDINGNYTRLAYDDQHSNYVLGNITEPSNISFRGDNLLIIEGNTIQEYKIDDNKLVFTGFAIAKDKTAYNRINGTAENVSMQKYGDNIAVLDDYKLTIVNTDAVEKYGVENYKNYVKSNNSIIGNPLPDKFALGSEHAFLIYNAGQADNCQLKLLNFKNDTIYDVANLTPIEKLRVRDVCFQGNNFYLLIDDGNDKSIVYKIKEGAQSITEENKVYKPQTALSFRQICVDVFGNMYLANSYQITKVSLDYQNSYTISEEIVNRCTNIKKLATDLAGNLFILDDGVLKQFLPTYQLTTFNSNKKITSLAFDHIDNDFYLLTENDEFISITDDVKTISIEDLVIPSNFKLNNIGTNKALDQLKSYKISQGENAFVVKQTERGFEFHSLANANDQYVYVCPIKDSYGLNTLHILAGQENIVLALSNTKCADISKDNNVSSKAFVTSRVNALYYPVLTRNDSYYLLDGDKPIVLDKNTEISPIFSIDFAGQSYYYAKLNIDDKEFFGYVPKAFTVTKLNQDFNYQEYSVETVSKTNFYYDYQLTQLVSDSHLEDGTKVRLIEKDSSVSKIAVLIDGNWIEGYIPTKCINDPSSIAIRNVLVILAVVTSLSATSVYFLLKKKKNN